MAEIPELLQTIAEIAPDEIYKEWEKELGCCIAATAVGLKVCRYFNLEASPLCVDAYVGNREFADWYFAGANPMTPEEALTSPVRYVMVDRHRDVPGEFAGHLVVALTIDNYLLDLSFGQFDRPAKRIPCQDGGIFQVDERFWRGRACYYQDSKTGVLCILSATKDPPDWRHAPDWKQTKEHKRVAGRIIRKVKQKL